MEGDLSCHVISETIQLQVISPLSFTKCPVIKHHCFGGDPHRMLYVYFSVSSITSNVSLFFLFVCVSLFLFSVLSHVRLFETPWTVVRQAPLSMELSRQEYWSVWLFPPPGDLADPGTECVFPASQAYSLPLSHQGSPKCFVVFLFVILKGLSMAYPCFSCVCFHHL